MKKPVIAVDVDEVLLPLHEPFLRHHNEQYGTDFAFPDPQGRYYLNEISGDDVFVIVEKLRTFYEDDKDAHLQPLPGAVDGIKKLYERYDLVIVSNQQLFQGDFTKKALKQHFGDVFKEIHFTGAMPGDRHALTKSALCKKFGAKHLIDDSVPTAINCAREGIHVLLFGDYHWNKLDELPKGITRCRDWPAVLEYFDAA